MECSTRWAAVWVMTGLGLLACGEETEDPGSDQADAGPVFDDRGPGPDGGRGGPDMTPAAPEPPQVTGWTPQPGSVRVPRETSVRIRFSEAMDVATVAAHLQATADRGDGPRLVPLQVGAGEGPSEVTARPARSWPPVARVVVRLGTGALSAEGLALLESAELSFQTRGTVPTVPAVGQAAFEPLSCVDAWVPPAALEGPEGLSALGWDWRNLRAAPAWAVPVAASLPWVNDNSLALVGVRTEPRRAPDAGFCFVTAIRDAPASAVLRVQSAFHDPTRGFDDLQLAAWTSPGYRTGLDHPLTGAVWGLWEAFEPGGFSEADRATLEAYDEALSNEWAQALADFVHAAGEARLLREAAFSGWTETDVETLRRAVLDTAYAQTNFFVSEPLASLDVLARVGDELDLASVNRAAQRVMAATEALAALGDTPLPPISLEVETPLGALVIRPGDEDHTQVPEGALLVLDGGGDDVYDGQVASTADGRAVSVLLDLGGDDRYGPDRPLLERSRSVALGSEDGFGQGFGLAGVAILFDVSGDDVYRGSVFTQGAAFAGVGALVDRGLGNDVYEAAYFSQGAAQYGAGLLDDDGGNDRYLVGSQGQGMGRPRGQGLLLDRDGGDDYVSLYVADPPGLPNGGPLWFPSGYTDARGNNHNLSATQGVGWGLRPEWGTNGVAWSGGFGALVDLGTQSDLHFADTLAMGQGFVYGLGLLWDDGGSDFYRALWWGMGSGTHMGTGVMIEAGGDDDLSVNRVSAALGHDLGVSWYIDQGGDDVYGGGISFGRAYDEGNAFFLDLGGEDVYDGIFVQGFGSCHFSQGVRLPTVPRLGLFMDLGGGDDTYLTDNEAAANDARWEQVPFGAPEAVDQKKGLGFDR
ncbi:MAG TPA: Ig-like domain-containing protein [Myxococcales bacterium LLY-WYZ-16_1]|nr:Ig-like domain-containing protein [Myxococcales bacterium LLY-WYZ-16_1]